jgi:hypothetical protein
MLAGVEGQAVLLHRTAVVLLLLESEPLPSFPCLFFSFLQNAPNSNTHTLSMGHPPPPRGISGAPSAGFLPGFSQATLSPGPKLLKERENKDACVQTHHTSSSSFFFFFFS